MFIYEVYINRLEMMVIFYFTRVSQFGDSNWGHQNLIQFKQVSSIQTLIQQDFYMKQENQAMRLCFICNQTPIKRICLSDQCLNNQIYLLCDGCRKDPRVKKYASEIYQIDSLSFPFCLFSINSNNQEQAQKVQNYSHICRESLRQNLIKIYYSLQEVESKSLDNIIGLSETFNSDHVDQVESLFKNKSSKNNNFQLIKKVNTLKMLKQHKDLIENPITLSEKIHDFTSRFTEKLTHLTNQIQSQIKDFCDEFSIDNFFNEHPQKPQKPIQKSHTANRSRNVKSNKQNAKASEMKSQDQVSKLIEHHEFSEPSANLRQRDSQLIMELQHSKEQQRLQQEKLEQTKYGPNTLFEISANNHEEKKQMVIKPSENRNNKKKPKPNQEVKKPTNEQQNISPRLILPRLPTKQDYSQSEKLIINIGNITQIIWGLSQQQQSTSNIKLKYQHQNSKQQPIQQQKIQPDCFQLESKNLRRIDLKKIKYLQIQQLPQRQKQVFNVIIDGEKTKVVYKWMDLACHLQSMPNLEQLHIFTAQMFITQGLFPDIILKFSNLTVVTFNCLNPVNLALNGYRGLINCLVNQQMNILQFAENIPFYENLELFDLKMYYPQNQKNKKIYDQNFAEQAEMWIQKQLQKKEEKLNPKESFPHKQSCWFFNHDHRLLEKDRFQNKITFQNNLNMSRCFLNLRNCWISNLCKYELKLIQQSRKLDHIQHLTLGFHQIKLQSIPLEFLSGPESFIRLLRNLKSLNLVNLNVLQFLIKPLFNSMVFKDLESLKIEFCLGLNNDFYSNLPKWCPKLRKIAVNNIGGQTDGDFIFNLTSLQTIILPWSEMRYKGVPDNQQQDKKNHTLSNNNFEIEEENSSQQFHYKKWKYINVYGCSWFHNDFFALIDLKAIQHLNIGNISQFMLLGKCNYVDIQQLVENLKYCENLESLCLDELPITNTDLFAVLIHLPKLKRLSVAHCSNLDFRAGKLSSNEVQILDQMTHLDLRNQLTPIDSSYTIQMKRPKYLLISRPFDIEPNQLLILTERQIYASCAKF